MEKYSLESIVKKVKNIAESIAGKNYKGKIEPDANLTTDLGFDSIKGLRMIIELERNFGVSIADFDSDINFADYDTVSKISGLILKLLSEKGE